MSVNNINNNTNKANRQNKFKTSSVMMMLQGLN